MRSQAGSTATRGIRVFLLVLIAAAVLGGCSLFPPNANNVADWLKLPEPGTTYVYRISTEWHDGSVSIEYRPYLVRRVEHLDTGIVVKFTAETDDTELHTFYWLIDTDDQALYESTDEVIDSGDLLYLQAPVEAYADWTHGTVDYDIEDLDASESVGDIVIDGTEYDDIDYEDLVEIELRYDGVSSSVDCYAYWSTEYGLVKYEEDYPIQTGAYLDNYRRELVGRF